MKSTRNLFFWLYIKFPSLRNILVRFFTWRTFHKTKWSISTVKAHAIRNEFIDMKNIMGKTDVHIVDGGANVGLFTKCLKMYLPDSTIYSFEPQEHLNLKEKLKGFQDVHVITAALGDKDKKVDFFISIDDRESQSSSLIKTDKKKAKKITVPMVTLDNWVKENKIKKIDILKLDLEGYDLKALEGAKKLLSNSVKIVFVEIQFIDLRKGQPSFCDYVEFLKNYGFEFFNFYGLSTRKDGHVTGGNALFMKN